jgi:hypothetical protein
VCVCKWEVGGGGSLSHVQTGQARRTHIIQRHIVLDVRTSVGGLLAGVAFVARQAPAVAAPTCSRVTTSSMWPCHTAALSAVCACAPVQGS